MSDNDHKWECVDCDFKVTYTSISWAYFMMARHSRSCLNKHDMDRWEMQLKLKVNDNVTVKEW